MKSNALSVGLKCGLLVAFLAVVAAIPATSGAYGSQASSPATRMELTTSSEQAKSLFREALFETQNIGGTRARLRINEAVKADPSFALARVYEAFVGPADAAAREKAISGVISEMGSVSMPEMLFALYLRESAAGRAAAALPVIRAVAELVPGDPEMVYFYVNAALTGKPVNDQVDLLKDNVAKFPAHAASRNQLAYSLYAAGDSAGALREVQEYLKLAPNHPNAPDSMADILLLLRKPLEALPHVQRELELLPTSIAGLEKLGVIYLMTGDAAKARAEFARGLQLDTAAAAKFNLMHWMAATYAYTGDGKSALAELSKIAAAAEAQNLPAQVRTARERMAVVEAYLGDRNAVAAHLSAASTGPPPAAYHALRAIACIRIGDLDQARKATVQYTSMVPPTNMFPHTLNALIALQAKDFTTAEKELAVAPPINLFTKAVRADLLLRKGQKSEGDALRQEVVTSAIKLDAGAAIDYFKLAAKMHADKL